MTADQGIIEGLLQCRGQDAARAYARQTQRVYRQAVLNPQHFASTSQYRRAFITGYLFYKHYLLTHSAAPDKPTTQSKAHRSRTLKDAPDKTTNKCERMIDAQLDGTFPASDPPSWTLGGSLVSQHNRH